MRIGRPIRGHHLLNTIQAIPNNTSRDPLMMPFLLAFIGRIQAALFEWDSFRWCVQFIT